MPDRVLATPSAPPTVRVDRHGLAGAFGDVGTLVLPGLHRGRVRTPATGATGISAGDT